MASVLHLLFRRLPAAGLWQKLDPQTHGQRFWFCRLRPPKKSSMVKCCLVDKETLDAMDLRPGRIRENITTEGLNVNGLHGRTPVPSARCSCK